MAENQQILTIARMRAEAEDVYGMRLGDIGPAADKITGGFARDDGASVRKVVHPHHSTSAMLTMQYRLMMVFAVKWKKQQKTTEK